MEEARRILNKKALYREEMERALPKELSDALWTRSEERLAGILLKYGSLPKGVRMHTDSRIFPSAAVYLTLKEELGEEKAYRILEDAVIKGCEEIAQKLARMMRIPGMPALFVKIWDPLVRKVFGTGSGFTNVFYPKKKGEYRMDVTECPYRKYCAELGCPEITKMFCENDDRMYGNLPGISFERTGTLGKGADRCDFLIRLKKD